MFETSFLTLANRNIRQSQLQEIDFPERVITMEDVKEMSVGILYIAIGRYSAFFDGFYESCKKRLFPGVKKNFYVYSDCLTIDKSKGFDDIQLFHCEDLGWPENTLFRFKLFNETRQFWVDNDYLIFFNGNTYFESRIEFHEFFPLNCPQITMLSWHIYDTKKPDEYPYDRNPSCCAYIPFGKGTRYFQGGLIAAGKDEFIDIVESCDNAIRQDYNKGIVAINHDESQLNRYLLDKNPKVLSTEYGRPQEWKTPISPKIIFRDKNALLGTEYINKLKRRERKNLIKRVINRLFKR